MQLSTNSKKRMSKDGQSLCKMFSALLDCSGEWIDKNVVDNFVDKVVIQSALVFDWYINLYGNSVDFINRNDARYCNEPYGLRAQKTIELQHNFYNLAFILHIPFEEVNAYKKRFGKYIRANQWKDITVNVYLR